MFEIRLTNEAVPDSEGQAVYGRIQIEDYTETFVASLVSWTPDEYESQWYRACQRLVEGALESALVSSYVTPPTSEFFMWWPLYREGEIVHVRNELVPYSQLNKPFSVEAPWTSVRERKIATDEGLEISEWNTSIQSIQKFLAQLHGTPL
jgi:hypothetical protein